MPSLVKRFVTTLIVLCSFWVFHVILVAFNTDPFIQVMMRGGSGSSGFIAGKTGASGWTSRYDSSDASHRHKRPRVLFGIFTADFAIEERYRQRHRALFALWNDSRVCALHDFQQRSAIDREPCELIYTFVMGIHNIHNNTNKKIFTNETELVDESIRSPLVISRSPLPFATIGNDIDHADTTILNIRENMNDGKSQTWWYYASKIALQYDFDYITKCDSDTMIRLNDYFDFAERHMAPAPCNKLTLIGIPWNKNHWPVTNHTPLEERYFIDSYNTVHIYCAGQLYTMSTDLAVAVAAEARSLHGNCTYCYRIEDHDVASMAYHNPHPIKLIMLGWHHTYWQHDVKSDETVFEQIYRQEQERMNASKTRVSG